MTIPLFLREKTELFLFCRNFYQNEVNGEILKTIKRLSLRSPDNKSGLKQSPIQKTNAEYIGDCFVIRLLPDSSQ